jgi:DNA-binding transcriptional LysR family regulator
MTPRQLEAFRALMEGCTVTQAGERLGISQPAVSKLIFSLERECGFLLFRRDGGRLRVSAEAQMLYHDVEQLFVGIERVERAAADIRNLKRGQLSIVAMPALAQRLLPNIIAAFSRKHPDVHIVLQGRTSRNVADVLINQQADMGVAAWPVDHPNVNLEPLCQTQAVCALPVGHRLSGRSRIKIADLRDEPFIWLASEDHFRYAIEKTLERLKITPQIKIETHIGATACAFVASGAGVAIVDPFSASQFRADEITVRSLSPIIPFDVWLLLPTSRSPSRVTDKFVSALTKAVLLKATSQPFFTLRAPKS